jgi:excinuclease ABC subunit A
VGAKPTGVEQSGNGQPKQDSNNSDSISIRGARQNNLKNLDVDFPVGKLSVVTGVSGSGKSSLVFDTLYAEGQRRYVETFSAYARQFLDRMDKPQVDSIEGVPPAIAIDQTNPVRTSRSTVGTMTELNDHLKLLLARAAQLVCRQCAQVVQSDSPAGIYSGLQQYAAANGDPRLMICFAVNIPSNFGSSEVEQYLQAQGYTRLHHREKETLFVNQDRFRISAVDSARALEAIETALRLGGGKLVVFVLPDGVDAEAVEQQPRLAYSNGLHCAACDISYSSATPSLFSFNSPIGACEACRGFGRVIGVDYGLVIPDEGKTLREGAVKPWQTPSFKECQDDLVKYGRQENINLDTPWRDLSKHDRQWVLGGSPLWKGKWGQQWFGIKRFFDWLETKAYKMHIRVLLSKYRAYTPCTVCEGARLKPDALLWRVGSLDNANNALVGQQGTYQRYKPAGVKWSEASLAQLAGLTIHDQMLLPIDRLVTLFSDLQLPTFPDEATTLLLGEIRTRLRYLQDVGLGYLTLDRQSRTLSGGEVQRINLTTALGTSLVNALFVLDEPSIGLHPRDMDRIVQVMQRLRDAGNTLVVVEHDPAVMFAADHLLEIGPGPGERGGEIVFKGTPQAIRGTETLTGQYLANKLRADRGLSKKTPNASTDWLRVEGAATHNLKTIDVEFPLNHLVTVTGVSGSGKSTLIEDVLYPALCKHFGKSIESSGPLAKLLGIKKLTDIVMVDQTPIGKTTRSNPVSYVGAFDAIRDLFARTDLAKERGYSAGMFSFNAGEGRCPTCTGSGFEHIEMQFLSDVYLRCADCDGKRFRAELLEVGIDFNGRSLSVADILALTVSQALEVFANHPEVGIRLSPLADVGLEYLRLGQPVPTLSGGEAQRLKLAGHLADALIASKKLANKKSKASSSAKETIKEHKLFLFDEPTTGLHFEDIAKLLGALRALVDAGHSLIVIEHNLDVIGAADWLIDLGPEGGDAGGQVVVCGTVEKVKAHASSHTGRALLAYQLQLSAKISTSNQQRALLAAEPRPIAAELETLIDTAQVSAATSAASAIAVPGFEGLPLQTALRQKAAKSIYVHKAREHNLKNIDVAIPRGQLTVVTGPSGSGKSTLAFDIVFGEGQRRYLESLNAYARQFVQPASRPDVDGVYGIPPSVAIEQRTSRGGRKSTVATLTEIYHFLRLLYVKLGTQHCPQCQTPIQAQSFDAIVARIMSDYKGQRIGLLAPLVTGRKGVYTDLAKWAMGKGYSHLRVDGEYLSVLKFPRLDRYVEHDIDLPIMDLVVDPARETELREAVKTALSFGKGVMSLVTGLDDLSKAIDRGDVRGTSAKAKARIFSTKRACPSCSRSFVELDPRLFSFNSSHGWCTACVGTGLTLLGKIDDDKDRNRERGWEDIGESIEASTDACKSCDGERLNEVARAVYWQGQSITKLTGAAVEDLAKTFASDQQLSSREADIARDIFVELRSRLQFLGDVGLGYLSLDRPAPTLSGGEAQRIRLAAQLGSNLRGVCYVLDEPTIGLHPRDNRILLNTLERLRERGNTLLVVEHDEDTIRRADHIIDIGPGAGILGGHIVAQGTLAQVSSNPDSITGKMLERSARNTAGGQTKRTPRAIDSQTPSLVIHNANLHNLKVPMVSVPLARLTVVTGVSGSGKSSLARDVLLDNLQAYLQARGLNPNKAQATAEAFTAKGCERIEGLEQVGRVLEVDQTPIGKTPRSCPATYIGFWDSIRRLFADSTDAKVRGFEPGRFSFNTAGGRCEACEGQGVRTVEMSFLPDVKVPCDQCKGQRFNRATLEVRVRGKSIGDVLSMSIDEAVEFFANHRSIAHALKLMQDVGLGYLTLGQPSPTLSGGEAQRIKLVTELSRVRDDLLTRPGGRLPHDNTIYVLDEPTVGLHMSDVERLVTVLHRLVNGGHTVVVIEHDIDIWLEADWIIDLGPDGGSGGGRLVSQSAPQALARNPKQSHTGKILAERY